MTTLQRTAAPPSTAEPLTLTVYPDTARRDVLTTWRELEEQQPECPLASSTDWTEVWLSHYGALVPHKFVVWHRDVTPVAAALLTRGVAERDALVPVSSWHVGTAGEPDSHSVCVEYNALLCDREDRAAVWRSLLAELDRDPAWDEVRLDGFVANDLTDVVDEESGWEIVRKPARYVDFNQACKSADELIQVFGDSTRKVIRQNLRHYAGTTVEWSESVDHALEIFNDLARLHQQRWLEAGQPGCYSSPVFTAFHRDLMQRLVPQGRMALIRIRCGDETLGCAQLLIDRQRVLLYQGGRLSGDKKHSPGLVTDYLAMRESLERGYSAFDFMAGDSIHKQRLTTHTADLVWTVRRRPRLKFAMMDQLRQIKRWVRALHETGGA